MPVYEYRCEHCGCSFEKLRRMSDSDRELACPRCNSPEIERVLSSFATSAGGNSGNPGSACGSSGSRFR